MKPISASLAAAALAAACSLAPEADPAAKASDIRALRWLAKDADRVAALTSQPVPCWREHRVFVTADGPPKPTLIDVGQLAFESPALLGGAAARMGLSCSSCHLNGRGNPDFFLEGVSGAPGTADVTSSIFSKVRGNQTFDPVPIPDLAAHDGKQIADRRSAVFRDKVHGLVVEEFDGQEPPFYVFKALLDYLDNLDVAGCKDAGGRLPLTASDDFWSAQKALAAAVDLQKEGKTADALLMARVARSFLERLHERFIAPEHASVRADLVAASRAIELWSEAVRNGQTAVSPLAALKAGNAMHAEGSDDRSLYNPDVLRAALASER